MSSLPIDNGALTEALKDRYRVLAINLFGYGEIKPLNSGDYGESMLDIFENLRESNFHALMIENKEDIWPSFKAFLSRERETNVTREAL